MSIIILSRIHADARRDVRDAALRFLCWIHLLSLLML